MNIFCDACESRPLPSAGGVSQVGFHRLFVHAGRHAHIAILPQRKDAALKERSPLGLDASKNLHYPSEARPSDPVNGRESVHSTKVPRHQDSRSNNAVNLQGSEHVSISPQYTSKPLGDVRASCQLGSRIPKPVAGRASVNGPLLITRSPPAAQQHHMSCALDVHKKAAMPEGQRSSHGDGACPTSSSKKSSIADSSCSSIPNAKFSSEAAPHARSFTYVSPGSSSAAAISNSPTEYITPSKLPSPSVALPKDTPPRKAPTLRFTPPKAVSDSPTPGGGLSALETPPADAKSSPSAKPQLKSMRDHTSKISSPNASGYEMPGPVKSKDPGNSISTEPAGKSSPGGNPTVNQVSDQQPTSPPIQDGRTSAQKGAANEKDVVRNLSRSSHSDDRELHPKLRAKVSPAVPRPDPATPEDASNAAQGRGDFPVPEGPGGDKPTANTASIGAQKAGAGEEAFAVSCSAATDGELDLTKLAPGQLPADLLGARERKAVAPAESPLSLSMVQRSLPRVRTREAVPEKPTKCASCVIM